MGNGYAPGRLDDMAQMRALIEGLTGRLTELEKPMGGLQVPIPVALTAFQNSAGTIGVSTTPTIIASASIAVPAGYTQAVVLATGFGEARCSVATGDFFYVETIVTSTGGGIASTGASTSAFTGGAVASQSSSGTIYGFVQYPQAWANVSDVFTGITGGVMRADLRLSSQLSSWTADPFTNGTISLQVIFLP